MEEIYESQSEIAESIKKLYINIRKDGEERKASPYYYQRKLETLESYWIEYQANHKKLVPFLDKERPYFARNEFESTKKLYLEVNSYIENKMQLQSANNFEANEDNAGGSGMQKNQGENKNNYDSQDNHTKRDTRSFGTASRLDDLLRNQSINFKAFLRTVDLIDLNLISEQWEFEDVLQDLKNRWRVVDTVHWEIEKLLDGEEHEQYQEAFSQHEITYNSLKKAINSKLHEVTNQQKSTPQLDVPIFTGDYHKWTSFKDLFNEAVHLNRFLSKAQKMQHLKCKLRGEAERAVQHLPISAENYTTCWEILVRKYENKKLIFDSHFDELLNFPIMRAQSLMQIKKLYEITLESLNAIKNLGIDTSNWDPMIVSLLSKKLDALTNDQYIASLKDPREIPKLQDFLIFLESKLNKLQQSRNNHERSNHYGTPQRFNYYRSDYRQPVPTRRPNYAINQSNNNNNPFNRSFNITSYSNPFKVCPMCQQGHGLFMCQKFYNLNPATKLQTVLKLNVCPNCLYPHYGKQCFSEKRCRVCSEQHNTILHEAVAQQKTAGTGYQRPQRNQVDQQISKPNPIYRDNRQHVNNAAHVSQNESKEVLLSTALVKVRAVDGSYLILRALIDQGSQVSLITESAAQRLGLKRHAYRGVVFGIGEKSNSCKGMLNLHLQSLYNSFSFEAEVLIMNNLIKNLPNVTMNTPSWKQLDSINLADPEFHISRPIDLLLGVEVYAIIMLGEIIRGENQYQPLAQQTQLGWILCGNVKSFHCNVITVNLENIHKFWELEEVHELPEIKEEDRKCIQLYNDTTKRRPDGRYIVTIPLHDDYEQQLGSSKEIAYAQFRNLEKTLSRNPTLAKNYQEFISEYFTLGHMKPATNSSYFKCYLPHHAVQRADAITTKLRVVFNASAKTSSGKSLNDVMFKGPNLQQDLQALILKWRQYRYAYTADLEKMYRQVYITESQQPLQQILWRDNNSQTIKEYQLTTITYGTKAAPFLAMMTLKRLAHDESHNYPDAAKIVQKSMYTDDLVHGSHTLESGKKNINDIRQLMKSGGFNLRKWSANNRTLLEDIKLINNSNENIYTFKSEDTEKTLGILWNSSSDQLSFKCKISTKSQTNITKRQLLAEISKIFDPVGWLAPVVTTLKILFQRVWLQQLKWDDVITDKIRSEWIKVQSDIDVINQIKIPRWLGCSEEDTIEFHGFCDASMKAYAACVYARIKKQDNFSIRLVAAKTKVAPNKKPISLPRLELCGALLLSKLLSKICECYNHFDIKLYGWTDSMVVLGWLNGDCNRWKSFVSNRVEQITQIMPSNKWRYVKTTENPADAASRGLTASQLRDHKIWWQGPEWLSQEIEIKYQEKSNYETNEEIKYKQICTIQKYENEDIIYKLIFKYHSFIKIIHILAWILRAITRSTTTRPPYITLHELNDAKMRVIKYVQNIEFATDIKQLSNSLSLKSNSSLLSLQPYLDKKGILRVGGRLKFARLPYEEKHPIIIPHDHRLTHLLIEQAHQLTLHGGAKLTLSNLRRRYWVIGGIRSTKKAIRKCITCRKNNPEIKYQKMGDLPAARVNPAPPFHHTGVDYTGFVDIKMSKGRGVRTSKGYIVVFVCMVTKAIHLEVVSDLTSEAFLAALRRMAAKKGSPAHLYSDNGTNFVKSNRILQETYFNLHQTLDNHFYQEIADMNIQWHFNAPAWPSAGGLWERAVRSLKHHLKRTIGDQKLTYEEYCTLLSHIEASLNSRPLCALTENIEDLECLTPAHFLIGRAGITVIETDTDARSRWHLVTKLQQDIWKKWKSEYLNQLTVTNKWIKKQENAKVGDIVVIKEDNLPAGKWALGRILEVHPGSDGLVRVVTLKTKSGTTKRPVSKIAILPIQKEETFNETEHTNSNQNTERKTNTIKVRTGTKFVSLALMFVYFMTLLSTTNAAYNATTLNNNQSFYFDPVAKMQHVRDEWTLVVYFDMAPYWEGATTVKKFTKYLENICTQIKEQSRCNMILYQIRHDQQELDYYNNILLNQDYGTHSRQRRGLINGIGYVANSLFGVLDARFAEKYENDINNIRNNEKHMLALWRNQTSVIESEFNLLKRTEEMINNQHKIINNHLNKLDLATNYLKEQVQNLSILEDFSLSAIAANSIISNLRRLQDTLMDTLTDTYHGKFNIHLLTPTQLVKELHTISGQLTKDLCLPIENIQVNFRQIYQLLHLKARMTNQYFIFEIKFPLISRDNYELYKIISIPHPINDNKMMTVIPTTEYIAINVRKDSYISTTYEELQTCLHQGETYLCPLKSPIHHLAPEERFCELNNKNICEITTSTCKNQWLQLSEINTYFYFTCTEIPLRIMCEDQISSGQIQKAGLIKFKEKCIIKGRDFTFFSHDEESKTNTLFTTQGNGIPKIAPINHLINVSVPYDYGKIEDFTQINNSLTSIHQQIKTMKENADLADHEISSHDIHQYTVSYLSVAGFVGLIALAFFWRRRRAATGKHNSENAEAGGARSINGSSACVVNISDNSAIDECVTSVEVNKSSANVMNTDKFGTSECVKSISVEKSVSSDSTKSIVDTANSPIKIKRVSVARSKTFSC